MKFSARLHGIEVTMQHVKVGKRGGHIAWNLPNNGPGGIAESYSVALKQANDAIVGELNYACERLATSV